MLTHSLIEKSMCCKGWLEFILWTLGEEQRICVQRWLLCRAMPPPPIYVFFLISSYTFFLSNGIHFSMFYSFIYILFVQMRWNLCSPASEWVDRVVLTREFRVEEGWESSSSSSQTAQSIYLSPLPWLLIKTNVLLGSHFFLLIFSSHGTPLYHPSSSILKGQ